MSSHSLPKKLAAELDGTSPDFAVQARFPMPLSHMITELCVALFVTGVFSYVIFLVGRNHMQYNLNLLILDGIVLGYFILTGLYTICRHFYGFFAPGPWFVATKDALLRFYAGRTKRIAWASFTAAELQPGHTETGTIRLIPTKWRYIVTPRRTIKQRNRSLFLVGVPSPQNIARVCAERIRGVR